MSSRATVERDPFLARHGLFVGGSELIAWILAGTVIGPARRRTVVGMADD